ncbi:hypothetical protein KCU99_g3707, partial [Aureobasidium melanogenum]
MAPVSHFALAALAITSVAAAPLPTPPNSAATLQPRGFIEELIEETNFFGKYVNDKTKVNPKTMLENALEVEKQLKGGHDKRDEDADGEDTLPICKHRFEPYFRKCRLLGVVVGGGHQEGK